MLQAIKNILILLLFLCGCQTGNNESANLANPPASTTLQDQTEASPPFNLDLHLENYQKLKLKIAKDQREIKNRTDHSPESKLAAAENYMSQTLVDSIFPYWLGTTWDFNGHTERPRDGDVACGYFVSTTLRDLGIPLNRFRVAQKAAADIVYELCDRESIKKITSIEKLLEFLESIEEEDVLIVGLDFHVGFIIKKQGEFYFAHSNYIDRKGVEIELLQDSRAFRNTNLYVVGNLTRNKRITRSWLD